MDVNLTILVTSSENEFKYSNKRLSDWRKINKIHLHVVCRRHTLDPNMKIHRKKRMEKLYDAGSNHKKAGIVILISEKIDFKTKGVTEVKRAFIKIKGPISQK